MSIMSSSHQNKYVFRKLNLVFQFFILSVENGTDKRNRHHRRLFVLDKFFHFWKQAPSTGYFLDGPTTPSRPGVSKLRLKTAPAWLE